MRRTVALAVVAGLLLTGCGPKNPQPRPSNAPSPVATADTVAPAPEPTDKVVIGKPPCNLLAPSVLLALTNGTFATCKSWDANWPEGQTEATFYPGTEAASTTSEGTFGVFVGRGVQDYLRIEKLGGTVSTSDRLVVHQSPKAIPPGSTLVGDCLATDNHGRTLITVTSPQILVRVDPLTSGGQTVVRRNTATTNEMKRALEVACDRL